jgi:hypothetical protein
MTATLEDLGRTIERRWVELGAEPTSGVTAVDLPERVAAGPLLLGLGPDGARLLVPFSPGEHERFKPDTSSSGIQLLVTPLGEQPGLRYYLDVLCPRRELRWLFATFVADALLRIAREPGTDATRLIRSLFMSWKAMFSRGGTRLSLKQLAGLYGELSILKRLLTRSPGALETWRGPLREPHDFRATAQALEVKTTLSTENQVVHIHGLNQLAAPEGASLHLAHCRVDVPSASGTNVPELVADLEDIVPPERLGRLLAACGYHAAHAEEYAGLTFEIVELELHAVGEDFPRLTADSFPGGQIPPALGDFSYTLDLAAVIEPPLPESALDALLDSIATT